MPNAEIILPWNHAFAGASKLSRVLSFAHRRCARLAILAGLRAAGAAANLIVNGTFDSGADWTLGSGWSIGSGVATRTNTGQSGILTNSGTCVIGVQYQTSWELVSRTAGSIRIIVGGASGTLQSVPGVYTQLLTAVDETTLQMVSTSGAALVIDNVSVSPNISHSSLGLQIAAYRGRTANGPWEATPYIGPFIVSNSSHAASQVNGAVSAGGYQITLDDASAFDPARWIIIAPGTSAEQVREIKSKSSNTLTLYDRLNLAVADNAAVIQVQRTELTLHPRGASFLRLDITNLDGISAPVSSIMALTTDPPEYAV